MPEFLETFKEGLLYKVKEKWIIWTDKLLYSDTDELNNEQHYRQIISHSLEKMLQQLGKKKYSDFNKDAFTINMKQVIEHIKQPSVC